MNEYKKQLLLKYYQLKSFYKRLSVIKKALHTRQSLFKYPVRSQDKDLNINRIVEKRNIMELMDINNTLWINIESICGSRYTMYGKYLNKYCTHRKDDELDTTLGGIDGRCLLPVAIENRIQPIVLMRKILALKKTTKDKFTSSEIDKLKDLVSKHGNNWVIIAKYLNKTPQQCLQCYRRYIRKSAGRWSKKEDELLMQAVQKFGKKWITVSEYIGTRSDLQCRERYINVLDVDRKEWTKNDEEELKQLVSKLGQKWKEIGNLLGRNNKECRRRYFKVIKKMKYK
ncbi:Homeodomain-like protein [Trachipleistophora hominis]|uniref:Homeodomain-like protein n=1 Tax=Trachipleistophora hominis TaxID=72359 RepID=L7JVU4_TRAHO|nr:Homeodomain-like protein [Trachipleistophora hominis]